MDTAAALACAECDNRRFRQSSAAPRLPWRGGSPSFMYSERFVSVFAALHYHRRRLGARLHRLRLALHARGWRGVLARISGGEPARSEEHTSELQSRENLVCR